ncbi:MAG: phosphopyruvate hydratase [Candidatus Micrarchaeia archaeon]
MQIKKITLRKILDSRGLDTVEASVFDNKGNFATASSPSGTSRSVYEAAPFPKGNVELGIANFKKNENKIIGADPGDQGAVDALLHEIDATDNFAFIGGNTATAISIANAKLAAAECGCELYQYVYNIVKRFGIKKRMPRLLGNVIGGGVHSNNGMSIQEVLVASDTGSVYGNAVSNISIYREIGEYLKKRGLAIGTNIENAWSSRLGDEESIALVKRIASNKRKRVLVGIDVAASELYDGKYRFENRRMGREAFIRKMESIFNKYKLGYIEDPLESADFLGFALITKNFSRSALVVGDDLYATNSRRLMKGIRLKSTNALLIKVNQAGTLTDTIETVREAHRNNIKIVVSHRSGETNDIFISHLSVAFGAELMKCGVTGGERIAKINELARIEAIELSNRNK